MEWTTNPSHATVSLKWKGTNWCRLSIEQAIGKKVKKKKGEKGINKVWMKKMQNVEKHNIEKIL
jgi:hypothetical protein